MKKAAKVASPKVSTLARIESIEDDFDLLHKTIDEEMDEFRDRFRRIENMAMRCDLAVANTDPKRSSFSMDATDYVYVGAIAVYIILIIFYLIKSKKP